MATEFVSLLLLWPVLVATGYCDLRHMRIPNELSLVAIGLFVVSAPFFLSFDMIALRVAIAAGVLAVGFVLYAFGLFGGGDLKIFSALMLFVPTETISVFFLSFSAAMLFGIALMPVLRALPRAAASGWVSLQPEARFPMGISIALAGIGYPIVIGLLNAPA